VADGFVGRVYMRKAGKPCTWRGGFLVERLVNWQNFGSSAWAISTFGFTLKENSAVARLTAEGIRRHMIRGSR